MARKLRIQYPGAIYHPPRSGSYARTGVMSRGDRREAIFCDEEDRKRFISTLQIHAFVLMGNHFHVVIETCPSFSARQMGKSTHIDQSPIYEQQGSISLTDPFTLSKAQ